MKSPCLVLCLLAAACDCSPRPEAPAAPSAELAEAPAFDPAQAAAAAEQAAPAAPGSRVVHVDPPPEDERPLPPDLVEARRLVEAADSARARPLVEAAALARPDDADAWYWLGRVQEAEERWPEAGPSYARAVELDPTFVSARRHLAEVHVRAEAWEQALVQLDRLVELRPDDAGVHANRSWCLRRLGRFEESAAEVRRACDLGSERACKALKHVEIRENIEKARAAERATGQGAPPEAPWAP